MIRFKCLITPDGQLWNSKRDSNRCGQNWKGHPQKLELTCRSAESEHVYSQRPGVKVSEAVAEVSKWTQGAELKTPQLERTLFQTKAVI